MKRKFISIYFPHIDEKGEKHYKNVSVAFGRQDISLFDEIKDKSTTQLKKIISIFSYNQLINSAEEEKRTPSGLIKYRLEEYLHNERKIKKKKTLKIKNEKLDSWIKALGKYSEDEDVYNIMNELKNLKGKN